MKQQRKSRVWMELYKHLVNYGREETAYRLARRVGASPQHCNRLLAQKWWKGTVVYREERKGNKVKRVWASSYTAERQPEKEWKWCFEQLSLPWDSGANEEGWFPR